MIACAGAGRHAHEARRGQDGRGRDFGIACAHHSTGIVSRRPDTSPEVIAEQGLVVGRLVRGLMIAGDEVLAGGRTCHWMEDRR